MSRRHGLAVLAALALFTIGACAKQDGEGIATAGNQAQQVQNDPERPADNPEERTKQFVECMRAEGIDLPDPEPGDGTGKTALRFFGEGEMDKTKAGPAMEKCGKYMPQGGRDVQLTPEQIDAQRRFAECMRANGMPDWPDPDPQTGGFAQGLQINKDDPSLRTAIEKCRNSIGGLGPSAKPGTAG